MCRYSSLAATVIKSWLLDARLALLKARPGAILPLARRRHVLGDRCCGGSGYQRIVFIQVGGYCRSFSCAPLILRPPAGERSSASRFPAGWRSLPSLAALWRLNFMLEDLDALLRLVIGVNALFALLSN